MLPRPSPKAGRATRPLSPVERDARNRNTYARPLNHSLDGLHDDGRAHPKRWNFPDRFTADLPRWRADVRRLPVRREAMKRRSSMNKSKTMVVASAIAAL